MHISLSLSLSLVKHCHPPGFEALFCYEIWAAVPRWLEVSWFCVFVELVLVYGNILVRILMSRDVKDLILISLLILIRINLYSHSQSHSHEFSSPIPNPYPHSHSHSHSRVTSEYLLFPIRNPIFISIRILILSLVLIISHSNHSSSHVHSHFSFEFTIHSYLRSRSGSPSPSHFQFHSLSNLVFILILIFINSHFPLKLIVPLLFSFLSAFLLILTSIFIRTLISP